MNKILFKVYQLKTGLFIKSNCQLIQDGSTLCIATGLVGMSLDSLQLAEHIDFDQSDIAVSFMVEEAA